MKGLRLFGVAAALALAACAKDPTVLKVTVAADPAVQPIVILKVSLAQGGEVVSAQSFYSLAPTDDAGNVGPFIFPGTLTYDIPRGAVSGAVDVLVDGVQVTTYALLAHGAGQAEIVTGETATASVTLLPAATGTTPDGGTSDADGADATGTDDAATDANTTGTD